MKKTLLSIILSISCILSFAQVTVTHMDIMFAGDEYYEKTDNMPPIILGSPGGNKVWNFSFLNALEQDTVRIISPVGTAYESSYPNATLCMIAGGSLTYLEKNTSGVYILGQSDTVLSNPSMFMPLPLTYGATHIDGPVAAGDDEIYSGPVLDWYYPDTLAPLYTMGMAHTIDSALVSAVITNTFDVDAWGTVTMPDGNDYDALRVQVESDYTYSVTIYCTDTLTGVGSGWYPSGGDTDISNQIFFMSNDPNVRSPLAILEMDSVYVENATYNAGSTLSSVNTIKASTFKVYPIPASYSVTIETTKPSQDNSYELFNISGVLVDKQSFNQSTQVDLSQIAKGTYVLKIHCADGYVNKKVIVE